MSILFEYRKYCSVVVVEQLRDPSFYLLDAMIRLFPEARVYIDTYVFSCVICHIESITTESILSHSFV